MSGRIRATVAAAATVVALTGSVLLAPPSTSARAGPCLWTAVPSQNVSSSINVLQGAVALSPTDAWAVGYAAVSMGGGSVPRTLIEHWDGVAWSVVPSPNVDRNALNDLTGITAAGHDLWAVGYWRHDNFSDAQTLILRYHRGVWKIASSPNVGSVDNLLRGVSARTANDAWAVGVAGGQGLALHWDGTFWTQAPTPTVTGGSELTGVAADPAVIPTAVGTAWDGSRSVTLIEQWDGSSWSVVTSDDPSSSHNDLLGVSAAASGDLWAVGQMDDPTLSADHLTLAEQPNGATWVQAPSPNPGKRDNWLAGVAEPPKSQAVAVGRKIDRVGVGHALIQRWTGSSWDGVAAPDVGTVDNELLAVAGTSRSDVWAVGFEYGPQAEGDTLVLHGCV